MNNFACSRRGCPIRPLQKLHMIEPKVAPGKALHFRYETGEQGMTGKHCYFLVGVFIATLLFTVCTASAKTDKDTTLKDVMTRLHKGDDAVRPTINKELEEDNPDWTMIQKLTKDYLDGAQTAAKTKPPKGDKDSWDKLMKQFVTTAKQLDDAAKKKDKEKGLAAAKMLGDSCRDCHTAHKP
jgi:hypothetical protein